MHASPYVLLHAIPPMLAAAAASLIASVWQAALLVAAVVLVLRCLPGLTPAVRSAVWIVVLLLVGCLPLLPYVLPHAAGPGGPAYHAVQLSPVWGLAIGSVWLLASLLRLIQLVASAVRVQALVRRAIPVEPGPPVAALLRASRRSVDLCISAEVDRPSVAGFQHARILIPPSTLAALNDAELEHVVLHELEHLRRGDDWTNLLQKLALALFPLHPVLLWLDRKLCVERELACDDGVLRQTRARKAYAACLARLAEDRILGRRVSLVLGALGTQAPNSDVGRRVHRILQAPKKTMSRMQARYTSAIVLASVFAAAGLLGRSPQLISFAPEARSGKTLQARAPGSPGVHAAFQPASTSVSSPSPAPLRDVVFAAQRGARSVKPLMVNAVLRVPAHAASLRPRPRPGRHKVPQLSRGAQTTAKRQPVAPAPRIILTAWPDSLMQPRLVLTVADDFETTYAAVPVRNGWLILQL